MEGDAMVGMNLISMVGSLGVIVMVGGIRF